MPTISIYSVEKSSISRVLQPASRLHPPCIGKRTFMPHSFALVVRPNLFARRRESHNRGIYWDMNISSLDKTLRRGLVCIQIKRILTSTCMVFSFQDFLPSMKEKLQIYGTQKKTLITPLKFDGSLELQSRRIKGLVKRSRQ